MKKFAAIIIFVFVAGLWLMPVQRGKAQTELEMVEKEIRGLEALAGMCVGQLNLTIPPGPNASAEQLAAFEKLLSLVEECLANIETRLEWLQKRLGELLSKLPSATAPTEDPKRKKQREEIEEWKKRLAAAEEKQNQIRARLEKLFKTTKSRQPAPGFKADNTLSGGLSTTTITTPHGYFTVNLPADMRAGDTISGTVITGPIGQTEAERARNRNSLNGYQLMIANQKVTEPWGTFTWSWGEQPKQESKWELKSVTITLLDRSSGDRLTENYLVYFLRSYAPLPLSDSPEVRQGPFTIQVQTTGQTGFPVEVKGRPFDGDLRTTEIKVGGQSVTKLAESPRSCFFKSPEQNFGPTEVIVKEGDVEAKGSYRNLGVRLAAPKTSLLKGETTVLTVTVEGLKGIQQNVPLQLQKQGVVSMEGGDTQTVQIRPTDVRADGTFELKRTLTGLQAGAFGVTATVIDPARRPIIIPLADNGYRVKKEGDKFVMYLEGVRNPITGDPVDGEHKLEHQCPTLSKIPYINRLFLNKGIGKADVNCLVIMVTPRIIIQEE